MPRPPSPPCRMADCDTKSYARGLCKRHYARLRRHGDPSVCLPHGYVGYEPPACSVDGCDKPARGRGWCGAHNCNGSHVADYPTPCPTCGGRGTVDPPYRPHAWGPEWTSTGAHPGAVFRVCQRCAVRVCTTCAPRFATDTSCPEPPASGEETS